MPFLKLDGSFTLARTIVVYEEEDVTFNDVKELFVEANNEEKAPTLELVPGISGAQIWVDEEGRLKNLPPNGFATIFAQAFYSHPGLIPYLVGTVVILLGKSRVR